MNKKFHKTTILLGGIFLSILLSITLLSNKSSRTLNENDSLIIELIDISKVEKIFTKADADILIASKGPKWDGSLVASDFIDYTSIGESAFQGATILTTINLPNITSIGATAFQGATNLTTIDLLAATNIGTGAFTRTTSIIPKGIKLTESTNIFVSVENAIKWGTTMDKLQIIPIVNPPTTNDNLGIIIGASVGGGLLLIGLIIGGVLIYRKKMKQ